MRKYAYSAAGFLVVVVLAGSALAQEVEPNDICPGQHLGMPTLPSSVAGSLDTPPDVADVDFFRFDFTPGDELVADLEGEPTGAGTLSDPLIGLFDADCNLIRVDDDGRGNLNSRLIVQVPDDGVVILAATSYADLDFEGRGFSSGTYTLKIAEAPALIHSITGRLLDAQDGQPITGDDPAFATVALARCAGGDCREVAYEVTDADGQFTFDGEVHGLRAGRYQLAASADGYEDGRRRVSERFHVGGGERHDFGDFRLEPNELQISGIELCHRVPAEGGVCTYSLEMRNRGDTPFSGRVWSLVEYALPGADLNYAFQVGTGNAHTPQPRYVWVEPEHAVRVTFYLPIPPAWPALEDGGLACISAGIGRAPFAVHNVTAAVFIGCLTQAASGLEWIPPDETRSQLKASRKPMNLGGRKARLTAPANSQ